MCGTSYDKMPGVKRSHDDSENEDQDSESEHSSEVDFGQSEGSDSEESSDLDEQECDERRLVYATDVADLERQFALLREQLYRERLSQVEHQLNSVRSGESTLFQTPLDQLRESYTVRLEVANVSKHYRIQTIQTGHEAEIFSANQNYENEKVLLLCNIGEDVQERIRKLQEDRNNISFTSQVWAEQSLRRSPRTPLGETKVTVTGPYIVYRLKDEDILDDWTAIRKAVQASKQRKSKAQFMSIMDIM